jgi:hypothetical protein
VLQILGDPPSVTSRASPPPGLATFLSITCLAWSMTSKVLELTVTEPSWQCGLEILGSSPRWSARCLQRGDAMKLLLAIILASVLSGCGQDTTNRPVDSGVLTDGPSDSPGDDVDAGFCFIRQFDGGTSPCPWNTGCRAPDGCNTCRCDVNGTGGYNCTTLPCSCVDAGGSCSYAYCCSMICGDAGLCL